MAIITKILRYVIVFGLFGICLGIGLRGMYLTGYYDLHAPRQADAALGAIYPTTIHPRSATTRYNHSVTVYLTEQEYRWFSPTADCVFAGIFFFAFLFGITLGYLWGIMNVRRTKLITHSPS
jgi:hypothetical protein